MTFTYDQPFVSQGWQCPICHHVYAPFVVQCMHCPTAVTIRTTTGTGVEPLTAPDPPNPKKPKPSSAPINDCTH